MLKETRRAILIHYLGDESIDANFPHGNNKVQDAHNFQRTCPSVLKKLSSIDDFPANIYKKVIGNSDCPPEYQSAYQPKNTCQIRNLQKKERQRYRHSQDALYNLHELYYDLQGFIKSVTTLPDMIVICGLDSVINELEAILQIKESQLPQLLSYDTTFKLGDFYLSPLLFRHILSLVLLLFLLYISYMNESFKVSMRFSWHM